MFKINDLTVAYSKHQTSGSSYDGPTLAELFEYAGAMLLSPFALLSGCDRDVAGVTSNNDTKLLLPDQSLGNDVSSDIDPVDVGLRESYSQGECHSPNGHDIYTAGSVTYLDEDNIWQVFSDNCKVIGEHGILQKFSCDEYHGPDTNQIDLASYILCNCKFGRCVDDSFEDCNSPEMVHHPLSSLWVDGNGHPFLSTCADDTSVLWLYCAPDGTYHEDKTELCDESVECADGMCGGVHCEDTDIEGDPSNAGTVNMKLGTKMWNYKDQCGYNNNILFDYSCPLHTETDATEMTSSVGDTVVVTDCLALGFLSCVDGACSDEPPVVFTKCLGDTSLDPFEFECIQQRVTIDSEWYDSCDICNPFDSSVVIQSYCADEFSPGVESTQCGNDSSCVCGVCMDNDAIDMSSLQCNDTDPANSATQSGYAFISYNGYSGPECGHEIYDKCDGSDRVKDAYCDGKQVAFVTVDCPPDHYCFQGACLLCADTDISNDPFTSGEVTDINGTVGLDFCNNSNELIQVSCDASGELSFDAPTNCPSGSSCISGACQH